MTDVSVIGLGLMGRALAEAFLAGGHGLSVWNRAPEKAAPFRARGAAVADDPAAAVAASEIIVICVTDYETSGALLEANAAGLAGKTVVQLSSGTPRDAEEMAARLRARGADYLDGAILCGPDRIGTGTATLLLSGDPEAWARAGAALESLAPGSLRYLGDTTGAAAALDLAWLMTAYGDFLAAAHAANLCASEGVDIATFMALTPLSDRTKHYLSVVRDASYDQHSASLGTWAHALHHIRRQGQEAGIATDFPDFLGGLFDRAIAAGHGERNVMSLVHVLKAGAAP